jgi:hypothetical protein
MAEVLDRIGDAARIIEVDLAHEGRTAYSNHGLGLSRELRCKLYGFGVKLRVRHDLIDDPYFERL